MCLEKGTWNHFYVSIEENKPYNYLLFSLNQRMGQRLKQALDEVQQLSGLYRETTTGTAQERELSRRNELTTMWTNHDVIVTLYWQRQPIEK